MLAEREQLHLSPIPLTRPGHATYIRTTDQSNRYYSKMGVSNLVATTSEASTPVATLTPSSRSICTRTLGQHRTLPQPSLGDMGSTNPTFDSWITRANELCQDANTPYYNRILHQAWTLFAAFCSLGNRTSCPASTETVLAFLAWLDHIGKATQAREHSTAIARHHLLRALPDPTKDFRVKQLLRAIHKEVTHNKVPQWPRDPLPVEALRNYHFHAPDNTDPVLWCRDIALVALGLRTMRRPSELCNLNLDDLKWDGSRLWLQIKHSKTDIFANGKFLPIENTQSPTCPLSLLAAYLRVRPTTSHQAPLFLAKNGNRMSPGAISSVVKRIAKHQQLDGRFSGHSLRIGGATAAMEAGLSLEQIQAIGGWKSQAVHLYLRLVGTAQLGTSQKMGF